MSDKELLKAFKEYRKKVGRERALAELTIRKISPRNADLLVSDDYDARPRRKLRQALEQILGIAS